MNKTVTLLFCSLCLLVSCQNQSAPVQPASDEADFHTQALTQPYLTRKVKRWINANQGDRLLRELQYARIKHPALMQQVVSQDETPNTFYNQIKNTSEVSAHSSSNSTFNTFILGLDPNPSQISCKAYYNRGIVALGDRTSGVKTLDPDGSMGPQPAYQAYCDMDNGNGGWTMVLAQFEGDPVTDWNEGIQDDYDPTLAEKKGFAFNTDQLPADRTQIGLGKDLNATFVDYMPYVYQTGDLAASALLTSPATGFGYYLHRNASHHYGSHNVVEGTVGGPPEWYNTLSIDRTGGVMHTWAFSPNHFTASARGYGLNGSAYHGSNETFGWTLWVR